MAKRGANQAKPSKIPTYDEVIEIAAKIHDHLVACIRESEPATTLAMQVKLGMLVKILKTYHNLIRTADNGDSNTVVNLSRGVYEYALSFVYMIVNEDKDPEIYKKFRESALTRSHIMLNAINSSKYLVRTDVQDMVKSIEEVLDTEGYDRSTKSRVPKSWHPTKSYMEMAVSLGDELEFFYYTFYELTSTTIHPNWLDIRQQIVTDSTGSSQALLLNKPVDIIPIASATCSVFRLLEICRVGFIKNGKNKNEQMKIIKDIHSLHHSLHN